MRRITLLFAALAMAACADLPLEPSGPQAVIRLAGRQNVNGVTWTTSTTGVEMVGIGQYNHASTMLIDINDDALAVGWGFDSTTAGLRERAISWKDGVITALPTLGAHFSRARGSNNAGVIVGEAMNTASPARIRPVVWENGVIRELPSLMTPARAGTALAINERGDVVGRDTDGFGFAHAVLWPVEGGIVDLGMLPGASASWATGINRHGNVFGQSHFFAPSMVRRATSWQGSTTPAPVTVPGDGQPIGADVGTSQMFNDEGHFLLETGRPSFGRGVLFIDGQFVTLELFPGAFTPVTRPYGLNEAGDVVGSAAGLNNFEPAFWPLGGAIINLGLPPSFLVGDAHGINNRGLAIGAAQGIYEGRFGIGAVLWHVPVSDAEPPVIVYSSHPATLTIDQQVSITCTVADEGSGVESHTCADIVGAAYSFGLGEHTFTATAIDKVGNSSTASTSFTVVVNHASLSSLTQQFVEDAAIEQNLMHHLAKAAEAKANGQGKLEMAQLRAYGNIVRAQTGLTISPENAAILLQLAGAL